MLLVISGSLANSNNAYQNLPLYIRLHDFTLLMWKIKKTKISIAQNLNGLNFGRFEICTYNHFHLWKQVFEDNRHSCNESSTPNRDHHGIDLVPFCLHIFDYLQGNGTLAGQDVRVIEARGNARLQLNKTDTEARNERKRGRR